MKHLYSIILLLVFLVGTLQPVMPMIEYQLFEGDLVELLSSRPAMEMMGINDAESAHCSSSAFSCPVCDSDEEEQLLDMDYYPLAVDIATVPDMIAVPQSTRIYLPFARNVISPTFLPVPPPPKLS